MKKILNSFLLILFLNFGCSSDKEIVAETAKEIPSRNKIDFKVNGQIPVHSIRNLSASFCCSSDLSVSFDHWVATSNGLGYGGSAFDISLDKNGNILNLYYKDFTHLNNEFISPLFTPASTLVISDFQFVENKILKFTVKGKIFKETHNFFSVPEFVTIDATIEIKDFNTCNCNTFNSTLKTNTNLIFHNVTRKTQGNNIKYLVHSNNGYLIEFLNFNQNFQDLPLGLYSFNENSTSQRINFRKFIGVPRFFSTSIIPQEWLKYQTSGSFEIIEKRQSSSGKITKVKFNLTAKFNNQIVFNFENAILETQM